MKENYKDYKDEVDYDGACALIYAICSADTDKIPMLWRSNGNYIASCIPEEINIGVTAQEALDYYGITPYVDPSEMRKEGYTE